MSLCDVSLSLGDSLLDFLCLVLSHVGQVLHEQATGSEKPPSSLHLVRIVCTRSSNTSRNHKDHVHVLKRLLELEDPRNCPQLFLWCLNSLLDLLDDRYVSLCTRTCVLSTVLWIIWLVRTCLCLSSATTIPIKMLALGYLSRLLYRLDGWYLMWELPTEGDAVEEHVGEVLPIAGAEKFFSGQQETLLPSLRGVGPLLRRSASTLLLSTVKPLSNGRQSPTGLRNPYLMESTSTIAPPEARRRKVNPEGRNRGGQVVCFDILWRRNVFQRKVHVCRNRT